MSCSCKHNKEEIDKFYKAINEFRDLFIRRMTIDSETTDRRRKDFNQAIFHYDDDGGTYPVWYPTDMEMVLQCFDDAIKDYRRTFCDVDDCRRK